MVRLILPAVLAMVLLAATRIAAEPAKTSPVQDTDETVYQQRFERLFTAFRTGIGVDLYEPLEALGGARDYRPLPVQPNLSIPQRTLSAARDYARLNNSTALLIWHDGALIESAYFKGADAAALLPSRSLSKPMTAVAVGRALALGYLDSLDQAVADFIVEWRGDARRAQITVRHLLDMRAGFLPQATTTDPAHILNRAYLHPRHEELIIREYPVVDEPGSRYEYNNASSELVAVVIERATGRRYAEFVSTEVLEPLGAAGGSVWLNREGGTAHSGCCMLLPAESWLRVALLLLDDGRWQGRELLPPGYVAEMKRGTLQNPYYGLGIYVAGDYTRRRGFAHPEREDESRKVLHSEPYLADDVFLFDGNANQVAFIIPSERLVVLRMGDNPPRGPEGEWDNSFLPNLLLRAIQGQSSP